jgi:hypothetical protein
MKTFLLFIVLVLFLSIFLLPKTLAYTPPSFAKIIPIQKTEGFEELLAPATLDKPRTPYHPLNDWLQDAPRDTVGCLTAGCCYETSMQNRIDLVGNYKQMTNNYRHGYPDNCSAPLTQFVTAFYKTN